MGKVKKMVDLKPKAEKITEEQLEQLQTAVNENNTVQFHIGALEFQKYEMIHKQVATKSKMLELQAIFSKEYGTFDININDGSINYAKDE